MNSALLLAMMGISLQAQALALGAITVRSALGEPLRAEIEVPQISSEEAASFQANVGSAQAFRAAGVEYSPAMAGTRVTLARRPNGQAYLRLVGDRPVNEPFLGVVIEAHWATGRVVRDYTMLVDPPGRGAPPPVIVNPSQTPPPLAPPLPSAPVAVAEQTSQSEPPVSAPRPAPVSPAIIESSKPPVTRPTSPPAVSKPAETKRAVEPRVRARLPAASGDAARVTVQRGDTAYGLASANRPEGVSLDQMLVAMLRANPNAFVRGNVNRMKAGAVLNMPSAEQATSISRNAARRAVVAHSRDFHSFRRGLAQAAPRTQVAAADRTATGRVQTEVRDSRAASTSPDRLTLSAGGVKTGAASASAETKVAQSRQAKEQAERVAELNKNISELSRLKDTSGAAAAGAAAGAGAATGSTPAIKVPAAGQATTTPPAAAPTAAADKAAADKAAADKAAADKAAADKAASDKAAADKAPADKAAADQASAAASAQQAAAAAAAAAVKDVASAPPPAATTASAAPPAASAPPVAVKKPTVVAPAPVEEPSLLDSLMENPLIPAAGVGLLALLGGYGVYRARKKKKDTAPLDSSFNESRLQPDSFFGGSGGQRVDTKESNSRSGQSSMAYSPSQLDAAGDVDPVAEADVYLAYGRDVQAEEILKEALRTHPGRVSIHRKLVEIYAKRRDARALDAIATDAHAVTHGVGPDWDFIAAQGHELDPQNPLYRPGGAPVSHHAPVPPHRGFGADTEPQASLPPITHEPVSGGIPLDLDLDLDSAPVKASPAKPPSVAAPVVATAAAAAAAGAAMAAHAAPAPMHPLAPAPNNAPAPPAELAPLDFDLDLGLDDPVAAPAAHPPAVVAPAAPMATPRAAAAAPVAAARVDSPPSGMIEFDLDALSVNPDSRSGGELRTEQPEDADEDPLGTKLSLAQEFHAIGDTDGARSLVKEVVAEASGPLKARAERFLAELS